MKTVMYEGLSKTFRNWFKYRQRTLFLLSMIFLALKNWKKFQDFPVPIGMLVTEHSIKHSQHEVTNRSFANTAQRTQTFSFMSNCSRSTSGCSATMERRECGKQGMRFCRQSSDCTSAGIWSTAYTHQPAPLCTSRTSAFITNTAESTFTRQTCSLTRWPRCTRYLVFCQYCLVVTYKLTCTSNHCGQRLPRIHINFNATSKQCIPVLPSTKFVQQ